MQPKIKSYVSIRGAGAFLLIVLLGGLYYAALTASTPFTSLTSYINTENMPAYRKVNNAATVTHTKQIFTLEKDDDSNDEGEDDDTAGTAELEIIPRTIADRQQWIVKTLLELKSSLGTNVSIKDVKEKFHNLRHGGSKDIVISDLSDLLDTAATGSGRPQITSDSLDQALSNFNLDDFVWSNLEPGQLQPDLMPSLWNRVIITHYIKRTFYICVEEAHTPK